MDCMIGWLVEWKCLVACLFFDWSQQPTWPHDEHIRRCTQVSPIFKHSSQPLVLGLTSLIWSRCVHCLAIGHLPLGQRTIGYLATAIHRPSSIVYRPHYNPNKY